MVKFILEIAIESDGHDLEIEQVLNKPDGSNHWLDEIELKTYYGLLAACIYSEPRAKIIEVKHE